MPVKELAEEASSIWLSALLTALWPKVDATVQHTIRTIILPEIDARLPSALRGKLSITGDLGVGVPKFGPFKVFKADDGSHAKLQIGIEWAPKDVDMALHFKLGLINPAILVKDFSFKGTVIARLDQLLDKLPFIGGLSIHLLDPPEVNFDLGGLAAMGDWPGIRKIVRQTVDWVIASNIVMPNHAVIPLGDGVPGFSMDALKFPAPLGRLTVRLVNARNLQDTDSWPQGKSDPYIEVKIGGAGA